VESLLLAQKGQDGYVGYTEPEPVLTDGHGFSFPTNSRTFPLRISYSLEPDLSVEDFKNILIASTLAERRPAQDLARLERMLRHADVIVTARNGERLVGISRAVTDFSYCCYLSDLAVDKEYQRQGIGRGLIEATHRAAGDTTTLILVAAPAAEAYYPKIGMKHLANCWAIPRKQ